MGVTVIGSAPAPTTTSLPLLDSPLTSADMDFESGAGARMTRAPPNFCSSATGSPVQVSTEWGAPGFCPEAFFSVAPPLAIVGGPNLPADGTPTLSGAAVPCPANCTAAPGP